LVYIFVLNKARSTSVKWEVGALSEAGPVREENQDRMCGRQARLGQLYVVSDGMGGHQGGARAAELTAEGLCHHLNEAPPGTRVAVALKQAFDTTNQIVYEKAHSGDPQTQGMGSTAVVLLISGQTAHIAHDGWIVRLRR
jgi:protein phosphatase